MGEPGDHRVDDQAEQDEAEAKKNKDWDPNAPLYGKNPAKTTPITGVQGAPELPASVAKPQEVAKPEAKAAIKSDAKPSADPLGDLAKAKAGASPSPSPSASDADAFVYFVQVGAYRKMEDAETQRAKLSLGGIESKISERDQSGQTVFRVRVGPFDKKDEGERAKEKLDKAGLETALVRAQR